MPSGGAQVPNQGSQTPFLVLMGCAGFALIGTLLWKMRHGKIVAAVFKLLLVELKPFVWLHIPLAGDTAAMLRAAVEQADRVSFGNFMLGLILSSLYFMPFLVTGFAFMAYQAHHHPIGKAYRELNASGLLRVMARNFSYVAPVLRLNLLAERVPGWEPPMSPIEFVEHHALMSGGDIDRSRAERVMLGLLGQRLKQVTDLKLPHEKIMLAIFAEAAWGDRKAAFKWLDKLNWAAHNERGRPDFDDADLTGFFEPHWKRWSADARVKKELFYHGYRDTLLSQLLWTARFGPQKGKLASSFFIWLKPTDHQLFFVLNQEGRDVPWPVGAAAFAQLQCERIARENGWRMLRPNVAGAIDGLRKELIKVNYIRLKPKAEDLYTQPAPAAAPARTRTTTRRTTA